jgi:hypothetical protein
MRNQKFLLLASLLLIGNGSEADEWSSDVGGGGSGERSPKWDFNTQPEFIGLIGSSFSGTSATGEWKAYKALHQATNTVYTIFTTSILRERLDECNKGELVRIQFHGKPAGKKYYLYTVNRNLKYVPNPHWEAEQEASGNFADDPNQAAVQQQQPAQQQPAYVPPANQGVQQQPVQNQPVQNQPVQNQPAQQAEQPATFVKSPDANADGNHGMEEPPF